MPIHAPDSRENLTLQTLVTHSLRSVHLTLQTSVTHSLRSVHVTLQTSVADSLPRAPPKSQGAATCGFSWITVGREIRLRSVARLEGI